MNIGGASGNGRHERASKRVWTPHLTTGGLMHELHHFFLDLGRRAEREGELKSALNLYSQAVSAEPNSPLAWYNYGDVLLALKRYQEAVPHLRRAVQLAPRIALFHYDLGLALFYLGLHEEASKEFAVVVADDPQLKRAFSSLVLSSMTNLALCEDGLGRPVQGVEILKPAEKTAADILYNLGRLYARAKMPIKAIGLLQAAALVTPDSEDVIHGVGRVLMDLKREAEAKEFLNRATKLIPQCSHANATGQVGQRATSPAKIPLACFFDISLRAVIHIPRPAGLQGIGMGSLRRCGRGRCSNSQPGILSHSY